jgi:hypothetical protein
VTAARIPATGGRIARVVNALEHVSFDAGPTLMSWLERWAPDTYRRFLAGDRLSATRLDGHGNAIAAPYHHVILPLAGRRDKRTEILWGLADFRRRFDREATGCWLPETAVDDETLEVMAECGVRFTILAPHQVADAPPAGHPGRYRTAAGLEIALAIYDGALSHDVAFGPLIGDAKRWATAVAAAEADLVGIATDGETFGHHHRFGEMALAAVIADLSARPRTRVENYAAWLARHPAEHPVSVRAPTSWSCAHGIERWRDDCGCRVDGATSPSQAWRRPLREALTELQEALHARFAEEGAGLFRDVWGARDAYGDVLAGATPPDGFFEDWAPGTDGPRRVRAATLLEMERHALGMMTSCGWFFDDVSGIESIQVLRYAARAIDLAGAGGPALEHALVARLNDAVSNVASAGTARELYRGRVVPLRTAPARVAAGAVAAHVLGIPVAEAVPDAYEADEPENGAVTVRHLRTGQAVRVPVQVSRPRPGRVAIVTGDGAERVPVPYAALPEVSRELVIARLRREVMDLWLTDAEEAAIRDGTPPGEVVGRALTRAIAALGTDAGPIGIAQVLDLLDLAELWAVSIPFDAQTAFADLRGHLPADARLAAIAHRLGFA